MVDTDHMGGSSGWRINSHVYTPNPVHEDSHKHILCWCRYTNHPDNHHRDHSTKEKKTEIIVHTKRGVILGVVVQSASGYRLSFRFCPANRDENKKRGVFRMNLGSTDMIHASLKWSFFDRRVQ